MSWLGLAASLAKLFAALAKLFADRKLIAAGEAAGRAASDAAHARAANEAGRAMQDIAARSPGRDEAIGRLDRGDA